MYPDNVLSEYQLSSKPMCACVTALVITLATESAFCTTPAIRDLVAVQCVMSTASYTTENGVGNMMCLGCAIVELESSDGPSVIHD